MDVSYSSSSLQGYKSHLHTRVVTLPLKYSPVAKAPSPNDLFHAKLATSGDVIELDNSLINGIVYEVLGDKRTIIVTPITTGPNHLSLQFQNLKFLLPHPMISTNCISVQYDKNDGEDGSIIIDIIDSDHLLITFRIEISDLIHTKSNRLTINNFNKWGNISVPYSFELRSSPYLLKGLNSLNLIVSLKDGGLLHFQRPNILSDFDVFNFNEAPALLPLNFISGLFKKNIQSEVVLEGISSNSVVDVIALEPEIFATLSVSKVIKIWNLRNHIPVSDPIHVYDKFGTESWLTTVPTRYLEVHSSNTKKFLTLHVSVNSTDSNSEKSGFQFKTWDVTEPSNITELEHLSLAPDLPNILLVTLHNTKQEADFRNKLWFIQDFRIQSHEEFIKYHILWKSNTSSVLVVYTCSIDSGAVVSINWSHINNRESLETAPNHDTSHYVNNVLNSGNFDDLILTTSLNVLRDNLGSEDIGTKPLREEITDTLQIWLSSFNESASQDPESSTMIDYSVSEMDVSNNEDSSRTFWFKLNSLCEEYKKLSEESLAIGIVSRPLVLLSLQANGLGYLRPSHYYESFMYKRKNTSEGKLAGILSKISTLLSTKTTQRLTKVIQQSKTLTTEQSNSIFETYLRPKITSETIEEILSELETFPMEIINSLIDSINDYELIDIEETDASAELGTLSKLNAMTAFRSIKSSHEKLLHNLIVLILLCEGDDKTTLLINKILSKLNAYQVIEVIFDTSFETPDANSSIESSGLSNTENSLFWTSIVSKHHSLRDLISRFRVNEAFDFLYENIISNYDNFITDVALELINRNEGSFIRKKFFDNLNPARIVDQILIGLIYLLDNEPQEFYKSFEDYMSLDQQDQIEKIRLHLNSNEPIKTFLNSIFSINSNQELKKAQYYHSLSELAKAQGKSAQKSNQSLLLSENNGITLSSEIGNLLVSSKATSSLAEVESRFTETALKFEQKAIEILNNLQTDEKSTALIKEYYSNIFELSMVLTDNDLIYESLSNLDGSFEDPGSYKALFTRFIKKLIITQSISIIFPPNKNSLYQKKYLLIDDVLLQIANDELALSKSLRYYEYLYSWRLFGSSSGLGSDQLTDKRGAIQALYLFITRFRLEHSNLLQLDSTTEDVKQYKLKILELYMVILNCLRSFDDEEDRWILKTQDTNNLKVINLNELKIEYYDWLKELEGELWEE